MPDPSLDVILRDAVREEIISPEQADRLRALATRDAAVPGSARGAESARGLNTVSVAYALGALIILFAFAWFLFERWAKLGVWGVLAVIAAYAVVFVVSAVWLWRAGFRTAAGVATMLAVSLAPLVAWDLQRLAGLWPDPGSNDPLLRYNVWMAWRWIIVELATILAALLVMRRRPFVQLTWPIAVAAWGLSYHTGQLLRGEWGSVAYERWMTVASGLAILATADLIERWQERERRAGGASDGDFATVFWLIGMVSFGMAYLMLWSHAGRWRHLLPLVALAFIAISLYLRRRTILAFGMLGVFGYLAFLADDVFRDVLSFPVLLAAFGTLVILATVWMQRSFPSLVERVNASRSGARRGLPWSAAMSLVPGLFAVAMALISLTDVAEERAQQEFRQRLYILRLHSGSLRSPERKEAPHAPPRKGGKREAGRGKRTAGPTDPTA